MGIYVFTLLFILIGREKNHNDHLLPEQASFERLVVAKEEKKKNCYSLKGNIHNEKIKYMCFTHKHFSATKDENFKV